MDDPVGEGHGEGPFGGGQSNAPQSPADQKPGVLKWGTAMPKNRLSPGMGGSMKQLPIRGFRLALGIVLTESFCNLGI